MPEANEKTSTDTAASPEVPKKEEASAVEPDTINTEGEASPWGGGGWFSTSTALGEPAAPSLWSALSAVAESASAALTTGEEEETPKGPDDDLADLFDDSPQKEKAKSASDDNADKQPSISTTEEESDTVPTTPSATGGSSFLAGVNTEEELADKLEETFAAAVSTFSTMAGSLAASATEAATSQGIEQSGEPSTTGSSFFSSLGSTVLSEYNSKVNQAAEWINQLDEEATKNDPLHTLHESLDHYLLQVNTDEKNADAAAKDKDTTTATYEAWIRAYIEHDDDDEAATDNNAGANFVIPVIDNHYYAEESPHRRVWNERCHRDGIDIHDERPPRHYVTARNADGTPVKKKRNVEDDDVEVITFGDEHEDACTNTPLLPDPIDSPDPLPSASSPSERTTPPGVTKQDQADKANSNTAERTLEETTIPTSADTAQLLSALTTEAPADLPQQDKATEETAEKSPADEEDLQFF